MPANSKIDNKFLNDYYSDIVSSEGPGFVLELFRRFLISGPIKVKAISEAIEKGDTQAVFMEAHALKNLAGNVGGKSLFEMGKELEELSFNWDYKVISQLYSQLTHEFEATADEVKQRLQKGQIY